MDVPNEAYMLCKSSELDKSDTCSQAKGLLNMSLKFHTIYWNIASFHGDKRCFPVSLVIQWNLSIADTIRTKKKCLL